MWFNRAAVYSEAGEADKGTHQWHLITSPAAQVGVWQGKVVWSGCLGGGGGGGVRVVGKGGEYGWLVGDGVGVGGVGKGWGWGSVGARCRGGRDVGVG